MTNEVRVHTKVDGNAGKEIKDMKGAWEAFQKSGTKGLAIGTGIAAATAGFGLLDSAISTGIGFMSDSITKASDLNETMSKAEVIFGDNAKAVEDWGATMDKAGGLSKAAALDAASGFAGLFKTVGLNINQSTEMSEKLTQMGADLASFFNTDVGTALNALKSGLNGESEPLRQFNVFLSDTAVTAKLASMGVHKVGGAFTEAQKATARYQLILDQTGDAQGDFARTGDGLANSQRTLTAEIDNLQAEVGQELLPIMKDLTKWAKDEGVPALHGLFKEIEDGGGTIGVIAQGFSDLERDLNGLEHNITGTGINIHRFIVDLFDSSQAAADAAKAATEATVGMATELDHGYELAGDSAWTFAHATDGAAKGANGATTASDHLTGANKDLHQSYKHVIVDLRTMKQKLDDATQAIEDDMFAVDDLKRSVKEHDNALRDDIKHLHDLEKIKHPTKEQRDDILQTKDAINDDKRAVIENTLKLLAMGKISFPALLTQLHKVGLGLMDDSDAARELRTLLYQIDAAAGGRAGGGGGRGGGAGGSGAHKTPPPTEHTGPRAAGGPVMGGATYLVGEKGPELFTPSTAGKITANDALRWGGGMSQIAAASAGDVHIHIHGVSVLTPGSAEALKATLGPLVTKWQQDRRLLPSR
jgi:hypothetical protein